MSHCRWVVVAEDCFDQLRQLQPEALTSPEKAAAAETAPQSLTEPRAQDPEPPNHQPEKIPDPLPPPEPVEKTREPETKPEEHTETHEVEEVEEWTSSLPPSFRDEGKKLLAKLTQTEGFHVSETGIISLDGVPIEDYPISSFLRTTCIPFNRSPIPIELQEWLRDKGMTKFRNHLAIIRPKWIKRYSWRESTMAKADKARGPLEVPQRSSKKRIV